MNWKIFSASGKTIEFGKPAVMAIMNATPDSFSDGGSLSTDAKLQSRIKEIVAVKADIIDVGGESTRPGHMPLAGNEEAKRVTRVIKAIRAYDPTIPISVDTQKVLVARLAIAAGADFINDVSGLTDNLLASFVAETRCSVVLMRHKSLAEPVIDNCRKQMAELVTRAVKKGIAKDRIILDPGLGFGDLQQGNFSSLPGRHPGANLELALNPLDYSGVFPVLIGASRKRFIGQLTGTENAQERRAGSVAIAALAFGAGAKIVRAHDVTATVQARDVMLSM